MAAVPKSGKGLDIMEIVNRRFKEFREILKLSEEEFAEKTGIKLNRLKKIENGCAKVRVGVGEGHGGTGRTGKGRQLKG